MEIWIALLGGLILGWVLEWLVDWFYWRRGVESFYATEAELRAQVAALTAENEKLRQQLSGKPVATEPSREFNREQGQAKTGR
jgi:hypothetical protein